MSRLRDALRFMFFGKLPEGVVLRDESKEFRYGDNRTIHGTGHVDVEVDTEGNVVSVWFRCMALPFKQSQVLVPRADEMRRMYKELEKTNMRIKAVVFEDKP